MNKFISKLIFIHDSVNIDCTLVHLHLHLHLCYLKTTGEVIRWHSRNKTFHDFLKFFFFLSFFFFLNMYPFSLAVSGRVSTRWQLCLLLLWLPRWRTTTILRGVLRLARNRMRNVWHMSRIMRLHTRGRRLTASIQSLKSLLKYFAQSWHITGTSKRIILPLFSHVIFFHNNWLTQLQVVKAIIYSIILILCYCL